MYSFKLPSICPEGGAVVQVECSTFQIFLSHAHSLPLFSTVFNLVIPLSLCLIPFFSQYHLNDSCKPLRIFSCEWWGFLLKGEKKEIHSVGTFTSFPILSFLSFSHSLSSLSLCSLITIINTKEDFSDIVKAQVSGFSAKSGWNWNSCRKIPN